METDYISREAAVKKFTDRLPSISEEYIRKIAEEIHAADVRPVKRGEWETALLDHEAFGVRPKVLYCSECHTVIAYKTNFCPNCGAKMGGEPNGWLHRAVDGGQSV